MSFLRNNVLWQTAVRFYRKIPAAFLRIARMIKTRIQRLGKNGYTEWNLSVTHAAAIILAGFIYFEIYHHSWFLQLFFGTNKQIIIPNLIYIVILFLFL